RGVGDWRGADDGEATEAGARTSPGEYRDARHHRHSGSGDPRSPRATRLPVRVSGEAAGLIPRLALPGIVLAAFLLLPFLNRPFTIDDPLFIREAEHALHDPLHPADFEQVWNAGDRQTLSHYMLGGTLPAYVLAPV